MPARVAALYDIHGNLPALEAVLDEIHASGVDEVVIGGDLVLGPMPLECFERIRDLDLPVHFIRGNADRFVLEHVDGIPNPALPETVREQVAWVAAQLDDPDIDAIRKWPAHVRRSIDAIGAATFCHATLRNDYEVFLRATPEAAVAPAFAPADTPIVVCGHTHMQFDRSVGRLRVLNAGSVGTPADVAGAHWLCLGPGVELRRTPYDLEAAAARIGATRYPGADTFARDIVQPAGEAAARARLQPRELT